MGSTGVSTRRLNDITVKDSYPLPKIEVCVGTLSGSSYFLAIDLACRYHQLTLDENVKPKTASITKYGLYQYDHLPFGLCNAPSLFQRVMECSAESAAMGRPTHIH